MNVLLLKWSNVFIKHILQEARSIILGSSLKQGESYLRGPNSSYTYYPLLVGVDPLLQILLFVHQLCNVAFKALPAHQVSRNVCRRYGQTALAIAATSVG